MIDDDRKLIREIVERRGVSFVENSLKDAQESFDLTIISNGGLHPVPQSHIFGELYVASEGNLDFSSIESVNFELDKIIENLNEVLLSKKWNKIYLIPFGHTIISMNIKMAVYRVLRIETTDIFYFGGGEYGILERDTRKTLISARKGRRLLL